ncbi:MAG: DUF6079 family protein [Bacillota bacterium]
MKIRDLVEVPPVRTVIRLADLADSDLRRHLVETFIFTGEVTFTLANILEKVAELEGKGFFVIGNFGSGKSHLLNVLSLTINDSEAREAFKASCREGVASENRLPDLLEKAAQKKPLVVEISLVEHSNREYLEEIVLKEVSARLQAAAGSGLGAPLHIENLPRREAFVAIARALKELNRGGLLLLFDELSEFLRSKENPRAYNEDVRFLQYLGEFAETLPAWIVATMQENIENTGSLAGELLHKIKDRYPVRFRLSGEHVKEIVAGRLIRKKEEADQELPCIYDQLQSMFKRLPFSREDFMDLYPVHPATVEMLDELRPLFSQHRGVIDFIHHRLAGDTGRGIAPFIENSGQELLTPDYIFDHFRERLRETVETNPYSEQVFHHYEREAGRLFDDEDEVRIALRILKLLILGAVARDPRSFSLTEITTLLLYRYSILESAVNYEFIKEIMDRLLIHGAYISAVEEEGETYYSIDLKADVGLLLEKKLKKIKNELTSGDRRVIEELIAWVDESYLPLKRMQQYPSRDIEITWQNTRREGKIFFSSPAELKSEDTAGLEKELIEGETDFLFFLVPPQLPGEKVDSVDFWQAYFNQCSNEMRQSMILWAPRSLNSSEKNILQDAYAYQRLYEEYAGDNSPVGRQAERQLALLLNEEKSKVKELFRKLYFSGRLKAGSQMPSLSTFGYLSFTDFVARAAAEVLKERYPRHAEIRPLSEQVSGSLVQRTIDLLFSTELQGESFERGVRLVIENFVAPLGLVKKKGQGFFLDINPKTSPLVADFLANIPGEGKISLGELYRILRKGPFGLSKPAFQVLGMAVILSGAVSAYQSGKRLAPSQVNYYRFWNIEEIGAGTLIRAELHKVLVDVPFLPQKLRSGPLTFAAQQQAWEAVIEFKMEWTNRMADISRRIDRLSEHPFFKTVNWDNINKTANRFQIFLDEIKTSYASREGLERFLAACQSSPLYASDWQKLRALNDFFNKDLAEILFIADYLHDDKLVIPATDKYEQLQRRYRILKDLIEADNLLWEEKYRERLKREFEQFRTEYTAVYLAEHDQAVGPKRIKPYRELTGSGAYRLLEQFGRINTLVVDKDLVGINRFLAPILEKECSQADETRLVKHAACSCGFTLGDTFDLPGRKEIEGQIIEAVRSYLEALQSEDIQRKIIEHAEHLELVGRRPEAEPLRKLLKVDSTLPPDQLISRLEGLINSGTVNTINRILTGDAIIAERSAEDLLELLEGRVFNQTQLKQLFEDWLSSDEASPPAYIRVTSRESGVLTVGSGSNDGLAEEKGMEAQEFLETKLPRLLPYTSKMKVEKLFALGLLCGWFGYYRLDHEGQAEMRKLVTDSESSGGFEELLPNLEKLGETLQEERDELRSSLLENAAEKAIIMFPASELIEMYLKEGGNAKYSFDTLLNLFTDEPFFPDLSREVAGRMARQISAEESLSQLNIMTGVLNEALRRSTSRERIGLTETHKKEKETLLRVLQEAASCSLILQETESLAAGPPDNDKKWERFYRFLSPFELSLARVEEAPVRSLVPEVTTKRWHRRYSSVLELLHAAFSSYLQESVSSRRQTLRSLLQKLPEWAAKENSVAGVFLVIIDGARLDIWSALLEQALETYNYQTLREGLVWAEQPTTTESQLQPLKDKGLLGHMLNMDQSLLAELVADPAEFLSAVNNRVSTEKERAPLRAIKYGFVDDKIHVSRDALPVLLEELLMAGKKQLHPLLNYIPAGAVVLLAADHGFRTNLDYNKADKNSLRYLHGEDTFFETLAPWALLRKR